MKSEILKIVQHPTLTYSQQVLALARLAESYDHTIELSDAFIKAKQDRIICDLNEGNLPYRPRYIIPDYALFMKQGSKALQLDPPTDLWEATVALQILYKHVPSITSYPVFLGNLDELLEPFVQNMDEKEVKKCLRLFLLQIDKTLVDSFVHANIGPKATIVGRILMDLTVEMQLAIPNLTLKYDAEITPKDFAEHAVKSMLLCAKPSFANHKMFSSEWGDEYAIASCYNGLKIGGGGFTLPRLRLANLAEKSENIDDFFNEKLSYYADLMLEFMEVRIRFMVEESNFFKTNFLIKEGLLTQEKFTGMFGVVGLAECVNTLLGITDPKEGYGNNEAADKLAIKVLDALQEKVKSHKSKYCASTNHEFGLHAQVGIDTDGTENSPGARIPIGCEPALVQQLMHSTMYQKYFPTGAGDVYEFDQTWTNTPSALLDMIAGAFAQGTRFFSGYNCDNDVVRVTGYLVKKSEIAKLDNNEASINNVTVFGQGARDGAKVFERRIHDESARK